MNHAQELVKGTLILFVQKTMSVAISGIILYADTKHTIVLWADRQHPNRYTNNVVQDMVVPSNSTADGWHIISAKKANHFTRARASSRRA